MIAMAEKPNGWETWVLAGCLHFPLHDKAKWAEFLDLLRFVKPDGVGLLGDTIECAALSKYGNPDMITLLDEFKAEQECKADIRAAAPGARLVETRGNHDFVPRLPRSNKDLADALMVSYESVVTENAHWTIKPRMHGPDAIFWVGQVGFWHGYSTAKEDTGDKKECGNLGFDNCLLVRAHTHRPCYSEECRIGGVKLQRGYANVGTMTDMGDKQSRYFRDSDTSDWGCAPLVVHVNAKRREGFATRQWQAEQVTL